MLLVQSATPLHRPTVPGSTSSTHGPPGGRDDRRPPARPAPTVLANVDSQAYGSLRAPDTPRAERYALGKRLREQVPRTSLGDWAPPVGRPDPVQQIMESHEGRLGLAGAGAGRPDDRHAVRVPARHRRRDGRGRRRGCRPPASPRSICGDAHLGNFGFYASPERDLVHRPQRLRRGPPRRLGVGPAPAGGEHLGRRPAERRERGRTARTPSRRAWPPTASEVAELADQPLLARSYQRLDVDQLHETTTDEVAARRRSTGPPSGPATGPATGRCPASPSERDGHGGGSSRSRR